MAIHCLTTLYNMYNVHVHCMCCRELLDNVHVCSRYVRRYFVNYQGIYVSAAEKNKHVQYIVSEPYRAPVRHLKSKVGGSFMLYTINVMHVM